MQTHFGLLADSHVLQVGIISDGDSYFASICIYGAARGGCFASISMGIFCRILDSSGIGRKKGRTKLIRN